MPENKPNGRFSRNSTKKTNENHISCLNEENPVTIAFREYAKELDDKHDRYERIVKLSRDITIESKRIIFLLHTICPRKNNKEKILSDAWNRLQKLMSTNFMSIAQELNDRDIYQYRWAFSGGLQEFIEAYTFHQYLQGDENIVDWSILQEKMTYKNDNIEAILDEIEATDRKEIDIETCRFYIEPTEFILGVADLTGEIMRRCINCLGSGDTVSTFECCKTLQNFYKEYVAINVVRSKELSRKIYTMRQSVLKSEHVCYNIKVRGGEAAKWGAVNAVYDSSKQDDIDEGFY